ncbi:MAG TPA: MBL fold metallo-hydrolase [Candidatus Nitrosocosmicus sp.]|nr:MBL fold metallo-hydrolase [Candidatus Nitrosocosmicus sp.]
MKKDAPHIISSLKEELQGETDEISRKTIERDIKHFEMVSRESFDFRLPETTFEGSLELIGASRKVVLLGLINGHTDSDIILYLPEEKVAFMGDLLFTGTHPWLGAGDPECWVNTIHDFKKYDADILVPGHGTAGSMNELLLIEEYIKNIAAVAVGINEGRLKLEGISEKILPQPFNGWKGDKFLPNLNFYSEYLKKA